VPNQAEWNAKAPEGPAGPQPSNMSVIRSTPVKWRAQFLFMQESAPPLLDVDAPLVKLIGTARRQIRQSFWPKFATYGLSPQQGWILRVLCVLPAGLPDFVRAA